MMMMMMMREGFHSAAAFVCGEHSSENTGHSREALSSLFVLVPVLPAEHSDEDV